MKELFSFTLFLFGILVSVAAQENKPGTFNKIVISNGIQAQISIGDDYQIDASTNNMDDACFTETIENNTLTISVKSDRKCRGNVTVRLQCPRIKEIEVSEKAELDSKSAIILDSLTIIVKSKSKVYLDMDVQHLDMRISEGGLLRVSGNAYSVNANVITSGNLSALDLKTEIMKVRSTSGAIAKVCVSDSLDAQTIGNSYIGYQCNPDKKNFNTDSGGKIEAIN